VQRGVKKVFLHAPQHAQHFVRGVAGQACGRAVEGVGEQVVLHDHVARHAQGQQDEGGGKAGAVFACGAVEDQGRIVFQQQTEHFGKARGVVVHKAPVGVLHQPHGVLCGQRLARALQLQGALDHGGLDGERVVGHAGQLRRPWAARSASPRKSTARATPRACSWAWSGGVSAARWSERKMRRQCSARPSWPR
jgi:hypothetical protein